MADENLMQWGNNAAAAMEATEAARNILESGLRVCNTLAEFGAYIDVRSDLDTRGFSRLKASGSVGSHVVQRFLGNSGNLQLINANLQAAKYIKLARYKNQSPRTVFNIKALSINGAIAADHRRSWRFYKKPPELRKAATNTPKVAFILSEYCPS